MTHKKYLRVAVRLREQSLSNPHSTYKDKPMSFWMALAQSSPNMFRDED
jgi:hypothetical protein